MPKLFRFLIFLIPSTLLRFYIGETSFTFLWFLVLYFPFINWSTYWMMLAVRSGINPSRKIAKTKVSLQKYM
jgi:hypothetical protein